jgi:tRNA A37 threonylcarbamoyladenosine synthetase subunit TsaC/SUA5/YrdC
MCQFNQSPRLKPNNSILDLQIAQIHLFVIEAAARRGGGNSGRVNLFPRRNDNEQALLHFAARRYACSLTNSIIISVEYPASDMVPLMSARRVEWNGAKHQKAVDLLRGEGKMIVTPTKVGYTSDFTGLQRKFTAKQRALNKPGVVLCSSIGQLHELAELNDEVKALYQAAWDNDILLGCILPWKEMAKRYIPDDGSEPLMMDRRGTSCFVTKFGVPSELIARELRDERGKIAFASSANPSGKGNSSRVDGIGGRISNEADLVIAADDYVRGIQPGANERTRYAQGVMVQWSMRTAG